MRFWDHLTFAWGKTGWMFSLFMRENSYQGVITTNKYPSARWSISFVLFLCLIYETIVYNHIIYSVKWKPKPDIVNNQDL